MKKIKFPTKNAFFYEKCRILKTLRDIEKQNHGFRVHLHRNHFPKEKMKIGRRVYELNLKMRKKVFLPKTLKQCLATKICGEKG